MTSEEWTQLFDLFHAARERSGPDRVALLDAACSESTLLRKAVEELLREDEAANGFLSEPLFGATQSQLWKSHVVAGQRFGRYVTERLIGRGGMGEVWSAQDMDLDRRVALKFLSSETVARLDPHQILREAKAASALNHHGIVTIHEVVQSESTVALVMELVEGTPLRELCGRPMPIPEVLAVGLQIAEALAAAHTRGIIHGDVKPENIVLRPDHYIKILDFGLAREVTATRMTLGSSPALGTLRYMSPEQARAQPLTPASDVFSFGLVLYELLTGRHAFAAASPIDTAQGILIKQPAAAASVNPAVPPPLNSLVMAMLAKDALARPTSADIASRLNDLQRPGATLLRSVPAIWKWAIAALVVVVACFSGWRWKQSRLAANAPTFRQITTLIPENRATAGAISPDGQVAAYANVDGIFLQTIQDGSTKTLAVPPDYVVDHLAWFSNGTKLVASGFSSATNMPSVWLVPTAEAKPSLLRMNARGATPSPDGTRVAYLSQDWSEIWVIGTHGGEPHKIVAGSPGDTFLFVFWSPDGRRLGFERRRSHQADSGFDYDSVDLATGRMTVEARDFLMNSSSALPDGRVMFLRWDSDDFISSHELWEMRTNPATGLIEGEPRRIATFPGASTTTLLELSATASGKRAMVLRQSTQNSVFVGDFDSSPPRISKVRRLTLDEQTNYPHAWTADSRSVIFESDRSGSFDLFKQDIDRRTPESIVATPMTEILPQLAPDGRTVLYASRSPEAEKLWYYKPGTYKLMRVPVEGGVGHEVPIGGWLDEFRCALEAGRRCVLRTTVPGKSYTYYDLDPVRGIGSELAHIKWSIELLGDWDISPDGTHIAIPSHDTSEAHIRVISFESKSTEPLEHEVVLKGITTLRGVVWAADGNGWFVSADTTVGNRLLYVYPNGQFTYLGDIQGWAVPSPDGRRVAFLNAIIATNAWLIERH